VDAKKTPIPGEVLAQAKAPTPLPHDGWRSRKVVVAIVVCTVVLGLGFVCLFIPKPGGDGTIATFNQWVTLTTVVVPGVLVPLFGALGLDKLAQARANGR
jgi:hypothetical protein